MKNRFVFDRFPTLKAEVELMLLSYWVPQRVSII